MASSYTQQPLDAASRRYVFCRIVSYELVTYCQAAACGTSVIVRMGGVKSKLHFESRIESLAERVYPVKKNLFVVIALVAALGFGAPSLLADHGDKGKKHGNKHADADDARWEQRDGYDYRTYNDGDGRPPGWSQGKKTGWGNCGLPPGQAKKYGCRTYTYQGRPYYYYQDDHGRTIVRRPTIEIHGSVDIVR